MIKLIVGEGSCGISAGAAKVYDSLKPSSLLPVVMVFSIEPDGTEALIMITLLINNAKMTAAAIT